jgi:geranylgeranyl pyrophosphate synthase
MSAQHWEDVHDSSSSSASSSSGASSSSSSSSSGGGEDPFELVRGEVDCVSQRLAQSVVTNVPALATAAEYFFRPGVRGKQLRPTLLLLWASALSDAGQPGPELLLPDLSPPHQPPAAQRRRQQRIAEIAETIHVASLLHDDVLDDAETRRGVLSLNAQAGNKLAILAGDFLLARASVTLASLHNTGARAGVCVCALRCCRGVRAPVVPCTCTCACMRPSPPPPPPPPPPSLHAPPFHTHICTHTHTRTHLHTHAAEIVELLSRVLEHLVTGEVMQMAAGPEQLTSMDYYLDKTYYKTASLMANSARAVALLGSQPREVADLAWQYGRHLGLAFQVVDDLLDMLGSSKQLGKPALNDLRAGIATAPVLLAAQEQPALIGLIRRKFKREGDVGAALALVQDSSGIAQAKALAAQHARLAAEQVAALPATQCPHALAAREALVGITHRVLARSH